MNILTERGELEQLNQIKGGLMLKQQISQFVKQKNGTLVESRLSSLTYQYFLQIDQLEKKRIMISFQERKNSYKITFFSKINIASINGGITTISKMLETFNQQIMLQNSLYCMNEPNVFNLRIIIQKQSYQIKNSQYLRGYISIVEKEANNFFIHLCDIVSHYYIELEGGGKLNDAIEVVNTGRTLLGEDLSKRNSIQLYNYDYTSLCKTNPRLVQRQQKSCPEQSIHKMNSFLRKIKTNRNKDISKASKHLAHKIKIIRQQIDRNWESPSNNNGILSRIKAEYITLCSFNNITNTLIQSNGKLDFEKIDKNVLIKKQYHRAQCDCQRKRKQCSVCQMRKKSFITEINIITSIRNIIANSVASYFIEQEDGEKKTENTVLYSQYYPKCLGKEKVKSSDILPLMVNVLQGLKSLSLAGIIHRDLKPSNILIDEKKNPKIIDFGSSWIYNNYHNYIINQQLYTTKKYNLYYEEALFSERDKINQRQFQQHPLYDIYAFGVILKELCSESHASSGLGYLVLMNVNWLVAKCTQHNPNLRPNIQQAINFCSLLIRFLAERQKLSSH